VLQSVSAHNPPPTILRTVFVLTVAFSLSVSGQGHAPAVSAQVPSKRVVTLDDLMKLQTVADARISPNGSLVAYVVTPPSHYVESPSWSPAGREIAYAAPTAGFMAQYSTRLPEER
jgi:hypothetical protein